ncbi:MAG: AraC family transcriptional regulator, partial [Burkholderiales bacterium]
MALARRASCVDNACNHWKIPMSSHRTLASLIARNISADGIEATAIPRVHLIRGSHPTEPLNVLHEPAICLIAQGRKQVILGDQRFDYDAEKYLIVSVDVPIAGQITQATPKQPYLCLRLDIDRAMLAALVVEAGIGDRTTQRDSSGVMLSTVTPELMDAAIRLARLLDTPEDIPVLGPLAERELLYRLLKGEQGARLAQIAFAESRINQVNRAIDLIKLNYREPIASADIANAARMSLSALHTHFKAVTAMSPLQYQKQLRLQEARRLMLFNASDAASA